MDEFWRGFEKQAASIIGRLPGLASGQRRFSAGAQGMLAKAPKPNTMIAPRSVPPPLPTPTPGPGAAKGLTPATKVPMPVVPKPELQVGKGVSSMSI